MGSCSRFTFDCRDPRTSEPARPYVVPPNAFFDCATIPDSTVAATAIQSVVDVTHTSFYTPCQQARLSASLQPTLTLPTATVCPAPHKVVRSWNVTDVTTNATSLLEQKLYFYGAPTPLPPVCVIVDEDNYPPLGFTFGPASTSLDLQLPAGSIPSTCVAGARQVFLSCSNTTGAAGEANTCVYNDDTDELSFDSMPAINASYALRQGILDGCGDLRVFQRLINVVAGNATHVNLSTCHDSRTAAGVPVLGERLPTEDVQTLTGLVCTIVTVTKTSQPDTWQVRAGGRESVNGALSSCTHGRMEDCEDVSLWCLMY